MISFLRLNNIHYKENVPISVLTGMKVHGILPIVAYPTSIEQLKDLYLEVINSHCSYDILAGLTNTYLSNNYFRDIVIITNKVRDFVKDGDNAYWVGCGYSLTKISKEFSYQGITGYEGFIGIPGTIGAAAINNSGAFSSSMSKVVLGVRMLNEKGEDIFISNKNMNYTNRNSVLKGQVGKGVVLAVQLATENKDELETIKKRIDSYIKFRKKHIDGKRKSLGSVFVSSTLCEINKRHRLAIYIKKIVNQPLKLLFHSSKINTYLDFLFLGKPSLAKYCDSLNRFCWDKYTTEEIFFEYIDFMQNLAHNTLKLEIEIRK